MGNRFKIKHGIILLFLLTLILRFSAIIGGVQLLYFFVKYLLGLDNSIINNINLTTFDYLISILLFFIIPIFILKYHNKIKLLNSKLEISYLLFIILAFIIIFAPLVTGFHPNAQTNIRDARFLPPFSKVSVIELSSTENSKTNFLQLEKKIVNNEVIKNKKFVVNSEKIVGYDSKSISSKLFVLGTDELGRDIFSRIIYGARVSLFIAFFTLIISATIGVLFGFFAANFGGIINIVFSRFSDMFLTIPSIFFVIMVLAFWGNSITAVIVVLGFTGWMSIFKVVKGEIASIIKKDYFITSKKLGLSFSQLLFREIFPVLIIPLMAAIVFQFSNVILAESALSFLGLGVGINYPSWGNMILSGQKYMSSAWWMLVIPSVTLASVLLLVNSFGEKIKSEVNPTIEND